MTTDFETAAEEAADRARDEYLGGPWNGQYDANYVTGFEHGAGWARDHLAAQEPDGPRTAPFGLPVTVSGVQEVWDAFVKPSQSDDAPPQSIEMRELMAILRWAYTVLESKGSLARNTGRGEG